MALKNVLLWFIPTVVIECLPLILATAIYEAQIIQYLFFGRPTRPVPPCKSFDSVSFLPWEVPKHAKTWLGNMVAWACGILWFFSEFTLDMIAIILGHTIENKPISLIQGPFPAEVKDDLAMEKEAAWRQFEQYLRDTQVKQPETSPEVTPVEPTPQPTDACTPVPDEAVQPDGAYFDSEESSLIATECDTEVVLHCMQAADSILCTNTENILAITCETCPEAMVPLTDAPVTPILSHDVNQATVGVPLDQQTLPNVCAEEMATIDTPLPCCETPADVQTHHEATVPIETISVQDAPAVIVVDITASPVSDSPSLSIAPSDTASEDSSVSTTHEIMTATPDVSVSECESRGDEHPYGLILRPSKAIETCGICTVCAGHMALPNTAAHPAPAAGDVTGAVTGAVTETETGTATEGKSKRKRRKNKKEAATVRNENCSSASTV
ncbi:hypothetical protein BGX34_004359 [Mortierella sp. NVP85]|nr:hypothetical protein BGX34_004359 [Mortierella sp. NVP85]